MPPQKLRASCFVFPISFALIFIATIVGFCLWFYLSHYILPLQPKAEGIFPRMPVWIYSVQERIVSTPVIKDSLLFLRTPHNLIALNTLTREPKWTIKSDVPTGITVGDLTLAPQVSGDLLVAPQSGSSLIAVSIESGEKIWDTGPEEANLKDSGLATIESYQIVGSKVYVARYSWSIAAYSLTNGNLLWESSEVPDRVTLHLVANSNCVFLGVEQRLQCFDPDSGRMRWSVTFDGWIDFIYLAEGQIYIALQSGNESLVAFDLNAQKIKWFLGSDVLPEDRTRSMNISGGVLYAGGDHLYAISTVDGSIKWKSSEIGPLEIPLPLGKYIIIRNTDKSLFVMDKDTGMEVGRLVIKANSAMNDPERSSAIKDGMLFVPFGDNRLFAYQLQEGP
jgi:outer membrane protein assembly factor BamB